ncbi:MAG: efflux RND transporter periplasmic adaptor subunit [Planctomycetota bacterium]|nr:efflux RND transporter periplasmic adaptor subunit [Planctomycetota bacterium]
MISIGLIGCGGKSQGAQAPPPPAVTVAHPVLKEVIEWDTYTGHLEAPESVNVAARVSGLIVDTPFAEGAIVKKGDLLFVIDDRPFKADLDAKLADQKKAEAQQTIAKVTFDRLKGLENDKAVSQQDVDNAKANIDQADAVLAGAMAAEESSQLNLEWCKVLSPINGRVSNKLVTVGNLVNGGAGQATLLTTIQSVTPMYCYVDVDEHSVLKYQKLAVEKKRTSAREGKVPCYVQLGNETGFSHEGFIDFVDNHVDPTTGTLRARGVLDNKAGQLLPGFFARLCIPGSGRYQTLLVPDTSIGNDQDQRNVLVVNDKNIVEPRVVQLGALFGKLRSIISGLKPDDRVIINGQMHARPGATVAPTDGTINVDAAAFSDPGSVVPQTIPTTAPVSAEGAMNAAPATAPSTQTTTGNRP